MVLYIDRGHYYLIQLGYGSSTNSRVELLSIYGLLYVASVMGLLELQVYGDSIMFIDWVNGKNNLRLLNLDYWCNQIECLVGGFISFSCQHIY